jgi:hypothetical protein
MKSPCATVTVPSHIIDCWSHRLAWPRTEPSQGLNTGSNPVGTTILLLLHILPSCLRTIGLVLKHDMALYL